MIVLSAFTAVVLSFAMAMDACSEAFGTLGLKETTELWRSTDPDVRAAGDSADAVKARGLAAVATNRNNVSLGDKMSFKDIDEAIRLQPLNKEIHIARAAMTIASVDDGSGAKSVGEAVDVYAASNLRYAAFERDLVWELEHLNQNLPDGSAAQTRVQRSYCFHLFYTSTIVPPLNASIRCKDGQPVR